MPPSSLSRSFPAWPTKGMPCWSSWNPGASPDEHEVGVRVSDPEYYLRPPSAAGSECSRPSRPRMPEAHRPVRRRHSRAPTRTTCGRLPVSASGAAPGLVRGRPSHAEASGSARTGRGATRASRRRTEARRARSARAPSSRRPARAGRPPGRSAPAARTARTRLRPSTARPRSGSTMMSSARSIVWMPRVVRLNGSWKFTYQPHWSPLSRNETQTACQSPSRRSQSVETSQMSSSSSQSPRASERASRSPRHASSTRVGGVAGSFRTVPCGLQRTSRSGPSSTTITGRAAHSRSRQTSCTTITSPGGHTRPGTGSEGRGMRGRVARTRLSVLSEWGPHSAAPTR